jgi:hypothetical protein
MKLKIAFDKQAIQGFLLEHVEKIVFGGMVVGCLLLLLGAFSGGGSKQMKEADFKPNKLLDSARNTETHWKRTPGEARDVVVEKYPEIAEKGSKIAVEVSSYDTPVAWNQPLADPDKRRGDPKLPTVEQLQARADRGALAKSSGAGRAGAVGQRWVVLTGVVPIKQQVSEYNKAFSAASVRTENDYPDYRWFIVERAEIPPGGSAADAKFVETPAAVAMKKLAADMATLKTFASQADLIPAQFIYPRLAPQLPLRLDKPWPDDLYPESLVGPSFAAVKGDPAAHKGKKVTWSADNGVDQGKLVVFVRRAQGSSDEFEGDYFAVDFATPDAAKMGMRMPLVAGIVQGETSVTVLNVQQKPARKTVPLLKYTEAGGEVEGAGPAEPSDDPLAGAGGPGGALTEGAGGPHVRVPRHGGGEGVIVESAGPGTGAGPRPADEIEYALFRFIDLDVQPGKTYAYRTRLVLANPNYGVEARHLVNPASSKEKQRISDPSAVTQVVSIPHDTHFLGLAVSPVTPSKPDPSGRMTVVHWVDTNGVEAYLDHQCMRGFVGDFPTKGWKYPGLQKPKKMPKKDKEMAAVAAHEGEVPAKAPKPGKAPPAKAPGKNPGKAGPPALPVITEEVPVPEVILDQPILEIKCVTGAVVLDMRGGEKLFNRAGAPTEPGEFCLLDQDGNLRVYSEIEGEIEFKARAKAVEMAEKAGGKAPGGTGEMPAGPGGPIATPGGEGKELDSFK